MRINCEFTYGTKTFEEGTHFHRRTDHGLLIARQSLYTAKGGRYDTHSDHTPSSRPNVP